MQKPSLRTVLICSGLFFLFLFINFPYGNLRGTVFKRIEKETRILINSEEMKPVLIGWPGIRLNNVSVSLPVPWSRTGSLDLASEEMVARVGIGSLLPPGPSASLYLEELEKGGDLYIKIKKKDPSIGLYFETDEVELSQLRFPNLPDLVSGSITAEADLEVTLENATKTNGYAELEIEKLILASQNLQGIILPALNLGTMEGTIQIKDGLVQIKKFQFGGKNADLNGTLSGEIRLAQSTPQGSYNLTVKCQFSEKYKKDPNSKNVTSFLESFPSKEGGYAFRLSATFQDAISGNVFNLMPKKL